MIISDIFNRLDAVQLTFSDIFNHLDTLSVMSSTA